MIIIREKGWRKLTKKLSDLVDNYSELEEYCHKNNMTTFLENEV